MSKRTIATLLLGVSIAMSAPAQSLPDFDTLWDYNNPDQTEIRFREIIPQAQQSGDTAYLAELYTQIARTLGLRSRFDEAHTLLDSVELILPHTNDRARVRYFLERGRTFNSSNKKDQAIPLFARAWDLAQANGFDNYAVDAAHMMAIAVPAGDKMAWNLKAVELAENSRDPKAQRWQGSLFNNIGWDYFDRKDYDSAMGMFERALTFRQLQGDSGTIRIARWCIARTFRAQGQIDTALAIQRALEQEHAEAGTGQDGYVFEEIGELLLAQSKPDEAKLYFAQAYDLLSKDQWLMDNEPDRMRRLKELGE